MLKVGVLLLIISIIGCKICVFDDLSQYRIRLANSPNLILRPKHKEPHPMCEWSPLLRYKLSYLGVIITSAVSPQPLSQV